MKNITLLLVCITALLASGCTENVRTKHWGGKMKIEAPAGKTVVNMTWKEGDLWIQYRDRKSDEKPSATLFKEYSSFGILAGEVEVIEK